jgi:flagellar hook-basal body complex protein FliE
MAMNPVSSLRILPADSLPAASVTPDDPGGGGFRATLDRAMGEMQDVQHEAQSQIAGVLEGTGADVHSALIAVEKADLSFQLMMQVRNKIVSAYQEISRMQF